MYDFLVVQAPFILDYLTIKTLFLSKKKISKDLARQKRFAIVLLILDIVFFIFNVPLSCTEILEVVYQNILFYSSNDKNTIAIINLLHAFSNTLAFLYYLAPFFINLLFNHLFREELSSILFNNLFKSKQIYPLILNSKNKINNSHTPNSN